MDRVRFPNGHRYGERELGGHMAGEKSGGPWVREVVVSLLEMGGET